MVCKPDRNKVCAVDGVKGVSINFSPPPPPKHETTSACYVWPSHRSSRNLGSTPILEAHPRLGADPGFSAVKPQPSRHSVPLSLLNTDTHTTRYSEQQDDEPDSSKSLQGKRASWARRGGVQGKDRGEGQATQWVADSTQRDREEKKARSWKAGTCHGHHRECQRELLQSRMSVRVWGGHPLATFPWALADSGADPQWHARPSQSTPEPQTQAGASGQQPCTQQLARQQTQAEEPRGAAGL